MPFKEKSDNKVFQTAKFVFQNEDYYFPCFKKCNIENGIVLRSVKILSIESNTEAELRIYACPDVG
jgi:hypothetical protein